MKTIRFFLGLVLLVFALPIAHSHQIDAVEFEIQTDDSEWRLLSDIDIAFMMPELRTVPGAAPLSRVAVMQYSPEELERIRRETKNTLEKILRLSFAGKDVPWRIAFPDFEKEPFELPPEPGDTALISVKIIAKALPGPGELRVHWDDDQGSEFIGVNDEAGGEVLTARSGSSTVLLRVAPGKAPEPARTSFVEWVVDGFRHVLPLGADHVFFILGLFLMRPKWKPLAIQSLLFTLAHSITLTLAVLDVVNVPTRPVEIFIAASIAWIGIENLLSKGPGKFRYILVFVFGLIHGLGFASVLGDLLGSVPKDKLGLPLLGFNVGVELAQVTVLAIAFLVLWPLKPWTKWVRIVGSVIVALAGAKWLIERLFFDA